ncbi:L,D-transpeptidase family protein [Actinomadura litoris]|uniref:L,D-transpeptidase family protein n=1 Tax=Actinomadura litoris TaxID=2678616 RepID=A0A7K1LC41_9ACTN|nr:L,D-transpeptidase family protein [Actinomadura litoris]MUN41826.1 L,D-transpeptidase family protein [Actinomadura litoris]
MRKSAALLIPIVLLAGCKTAGEAAPADAGRSSRPHKPSADRPKHKPKREPVRKPRARATPKPSPSRPVPPLRAGDRKLRPGAEGADVRELQRRLKGLHYDPGVVDGEYGTSTQLAVWAFQAVNRLKQSGTLGAPFWKALDRPREPRPMARRHEADRVDVDLRRQYLVLYRDGRPRLITHVSSGSGEYYCAKDRGATVARCRYATTGTGDFRTGRRAKGWEVSPLGRLYNPVYFNGGIAFHGALDVPRYPASHGCVRLPMHIAEYFPSLVGTGVAVHVRRLG